MHSPILALHDSTLTSTQFSVNKTRNESFDITETNLKHCNSEPDLHTNDLDDNDDDDVWCNPEDEDNLEHCVKIDQERIEQLRQLFGHDTIQKILDHSQVSEVFQSSNH